MTLDRDQIGALLDIFEGIAAIHVPGQSALERRLIAIEKVIDAITSPVTPASDVVEALEPFRRVLAIIDALPPGHMPADETPLREAMPGGWPSIGELRSLVEFLPVLASLATAQGGREVSDG